MFRLTLVLAAVVLIGGIFGVAALAEVDMEREIEATVESDTEDGVAVQFKIGDEYDDKGVAEVDDETGLISFDLDEALEVDGEDEAFNPDATFQIGDDDNEVFSITNNSGVDLQISVEVDDAPEDASITLNDDEEGPITISSGDDNDFYFTLNTGENTGDIDADLVIEKQED